MYKTILEKKEVFGSYNALALLIRTSGLLGNPIIKIND